TDYIDDVSATYADPFILMSENTPAAMIFGNRMLEEIALSTLDISPKTGQSNLEDLETYGSLMQQFVGEQRGDESNKDWYSFAGITITFKIGTGRAPKCPAFQNHYYYKEYRTN
ncbi:MAG: hypothetical protein RQ866_02515, partial [Bacteroidales bacterium]|nr:hypothetical protein [Bacteroidales bacterium]